MKLSTANAICLMFAVLAYGQPSKQSAAVPLIFSSGDMGEVETTYGAQLGFTNFIASDGVRLIVLYSRQTDAAEASRVFEQELSRAERVRSTAEFRDSEGKIGRRAVLTVQSKPLIYAVMWTSRGSLHQVRGASMRHILEFEKSYGSSNQRQLSATCSETAKMLVYSNAFLSEETGDVGGYEVALSEEPNGTCHALLFVYEGVANKNGIELTGKITGKTLTLAGTWVEHLVEHPSGKETTQSHFIRLEATKSADSVRGMLTIDGNSKAVRLKRTPRVWLCQTEHLDR